MLFGDSNAVVSLRWGLGGLRHFRGALRPRHSSRGLPTGSQSVHIQNEDPEPRNPTSWWTAVWFVETWTLLEQKGKGSNNCSVTTWPVLQNLHAVGPDAMVRATKAFKRIACVASDRGGDAPEWRSGHHGLRAVATFAAR